MPRRGPRVLGADERAPGAPPPSSSRVNRSGTGCLRASRRPDRRASGAAVLTGRRPRRPAALRLHGPGVRLRVPAALRRSRPRRVVPRDRRTHPLTGAGSARQRLALTAMALHWIAVEPGDLGVFSLEEYDVPPPGPGEVTVEVRAAGMNPADYKRVANADPEAFPIAVGYEVAGVISAVGPQTRIASGGGRPGDEVLAFRVAGGWATELTASAADVFAKPPSITFPEAANLLL